MKPTLRRNGQHMVTMQIKHTLSGDDITRLVGRKFGDEREDGDLTRTAVEAAIRDALGNQGYDVVMDWAEDFEYGDERDEVWAWAREQVLRLWPTLTVSENG